MTPESRLLAMRQLLDASPVPMAMSELETGFIRGCNRRFEIISLRTESDCIGKTSTELGFWVDPSDRLRLLELVRQFPGGAELEVLQRFGDGTLHPTLLSASFIEDTDPRLMFVAFQDLTKLRETQSREAEFRDRSQMLESTSTEIVARIGLDGKRRYTSPSIVHLLGWTPEEIQGTSPFEHFHPDDVPSLKAVFQRLLSTGNAETPVYRSIRKDGTTIWVETHCTPVRDAATGEILEVHTSTRDVTKRRQAEEALRQSEEKYRLLFENMASGFALHEVVLDAAGKVVDYRFLEINPAYEALTGLRAGDLIGRTVLEVLPGTESYWIDTYGKVALTSVPIQIENYSRELGKTYEVRAFSPKAGQFAVVFNDVTEQRAQSELLETTQQLARLGGWAFEVATKEFSWTPQLHQIHKTDPRLGPPSLESIVAHLDPGSQSLLNEMQVRLRDQGIPWDIVLRGTDFSGNPLIVHSTAEGDFSNGKLFRIRGTSQDITEHELVRQEFEAVSRMTQAILDTSEALIVVLDREGNIFRFNSACEKATGWFETEVLGKPFCDIVIPDEERESVRAVFHDLTTGQFPSHHENQWLCRDGRKIWTSWANSAILDKTDSVEYIVGIGIDTTLQKQMQIHLEEREALLRCLIDTAPEAIVILDVESGRFQDVNPAAERLFLRSREELLSCGPVEVSPEFQPSGSASATAAQAYVKQALQGEHPSFEWVHFRADGTEILCSIQLSRLPADHQELVRGSMTDISYRRKTESVMASLVRGTSSLFGQAFFDALVKDLAELLDVEFAFIGRANRTQDRIGTLSFQAHGILAPKLEYPLEGSPCGEVYARSPMSVTENVREKFPDAPALRDMNAESYMGVPLFSSSRDPIGVLVVIDEKPMAENELARSILTIFAGRAQGEIERLEAENSLRLLNADLERHVQERTAQLQSTNRELESFSYSVSHDLRSPLRAIDGFTQAIQQDYAASFDDMGRTFLERIRAASHRMSDLIDDLLSLSRSSRIEVRKSNVDLSRMAHEIVENLQRSLPEREISWNINSELSAFADPSLIHSVLDNLIGNAWKYTRFQSHPVIEFRATTASEGFVGFAVSDNGAGFDMAHAPKLFGTFQRLHTSEEFEGNGIGLATARRIIERHGGSITARGKPGIGATFEFQLPVGNRPDATRAPQTQSLRD